MHLEAACSQKQNICRTGLLERFVLQPLRSVYCMSYFQTQSNRRCYNGFVQPVRVLSTATVSNLLVDMERASICCYLQENYVWQELERMDSQYSLNVYTCISNSFIYTHIVSLPCPLKKPLSKL